MFATLRPRWSRMVSSPGQGFTLIELLVVIAVIGLLAAITFPVFGRARNKAHQARCLSNQRQLATAVIMAAEDGKDSLGTIWRNLPTQGVSPKVFDCPLSGNSGHSSDPDYVLNATIADKSMRDITGDPSAVWLTADGHETIGYVIDQDWRHNGKPIVSYLDGHVTLGMQGMFDQYGQGEMAHLVLPEVGAGGGFSWWTAFDFFPRGSFAPGRILALSGTQLLLQNRIGVGCDTGPFQYLPGLLGHGWGTPPGGTANFSVVGTLPGCDPAFVKISPSGRRVAIGVGWGAPMLVFDTSVLNAASPVDLMTDPRVLQFNENYYDGDWIDDKHFAISGGSFTFSDVTVLDVTRAANTAKPVLTNVPGASASITADLDGNIITGVSWAPGPPNRTGEIVVVPRDAWEAVYSGGKPVIDYADTLHVKKLADNILSCASLDIDADGNLCVGGGDAFGTGGPAENGYAALIRHDVVHRVLRGGGAVQEVEGLMKEYREFRPDPAEDDSSTTVVFNSALGTLGVCWNPDQNGGVGGGKGSATDYLTLGSTPVLTMYAM